MNKGELIAAVQQAGDYGSRAAAQQAVEDVFGVIASAIVADGKVQVAGFGSFVRKDRAGRAGRDPRSGDIIQIEPSRSVSFKAGKALRDRL